MTRYQQERNSGLDALRIISMMMIITLHILSHGGLSDQVEFGSKEYFVTNSFRAFSDMGVNCFILISSYFLCNMNFSIKRVLNIETQVLFYSIIGIALYSVYAGVDIKQIVQSITPVISGEYWFVTYYMLVLLFSPFLNFFIHKTTKQQLKRILVLLIFVYSIIPSVFVWSKSFFSQGNDFYWFLTLYFIGAYLRLHYIHSKPKVLFVIIPCLATVLAEYVMIKLCIMFGYGDQHRFLFFNNNPLFLFASICLFLVFLDIRIQNSICIRLINLLASCSFGVYLIHDNPCLRPVLWKTINPSQFHDKNLFIMIVCILGTVVGIYIACAIIDYIRQLVFRAIRINNLFEIIECRITRFVSHLTNN
ncbi:MAG: acyltransferase [Clostridia bacterium]|nr:acyltransferase [Clostridia bacterium]